MSDPVVHAWIARADNDLKTGKDEFATKDPATDTICFHMQQCVEKYLKAYLVAKGKEITKTHNLALILQWCLETDPDFTQLRETGVDALTAYATAIRYPDDFHMPSLGETEKAIQAAEATRQFVLSKLK